MEHVTKSKAEPFGEGLQSWHEEARAPEGIYRRIVMATEWELERTACFCCSCDESDYGMHILDSFCRNHGIGFGMRPCELHDMPGQPIDREVLGPLDATEPFIGPEPMPRSVQEARGSRRGQN